MHAKPPQGWGCPNPDPISDQNIPISTAVLSPGLQNPYLFSDLMLQLQIFLLALL